MSGSFLSEIILITVAAFIGGFVARTIKFPPVLGYIASGIVFGIIGKNIFHNYDTLTILSQVGVSLLLFTLGFEISIEKLIKIDKKVFFVGLLQILLTSLSAFILFRLFNIAIPVAIFFGILASFSSTAVVVKILEEKGLLSGFPGNNVFVLLLVQDLFIIPVIFLAPLIFTGSFYEASLASVLLAMVKPLLVFAAIVLFGKFFLSRFLLIVFRYPSHELTILATIFTASFAILALISVGLPESIAAFLAGVLISEQGKNLAPLSEIRPFRDLFLVLFFVTSGMLLNFNFFANNIILIVLLTMLILALKFGITYVLLRIFSYTPSSSNFIAIYVANIGEFAIVLAQTALLLHYLSITDYNLILSLFILSLVFLPILLGVVRRGSERVARTGILTNILGSNGDLENTTGSKFSDHVVIAGHGRVGAQVRTMLDIARIPYVVVDFNRNVITELISSGRFAIYGDPTDADILKASFLKDARILVIALPDMFSQKRIIDQAKKINPKITIIVRSHDPRDQYDLVNQGVSIIIWPELEAGLRIGSEVLDAFEINSENIDSYVKKIRRERMI